MYAIRSYHVIVVSPDVGGVLRARAIAKRLDADLAIIDKRRPRANVSTVMNIIGDVRNKCCVNMCNTKGNILFNSTFRSFFTCHFLFLLISSYRQLPLVYLF